MAGTKNGVLVAKNADFTQSIGPNAQSSESNGLISDGQLWIGTTAVNAGGTHINVGTLTAGTGINITNGPGSITIGLTGGGVAVQHLTADSGGQLNPDGSNNFTLSGSGSIATSGSGSTITTALTGLTNHAILVGAGTSTITKVGPSATSGQVLQSAGASADPAFSTATYPSTATGTGTILRADGTNWAATTATYPNTTTVNQLLYSSSANVIAGVSTVARSLLTTDSSGVPTWRALTDGQFVIGSSSSQPIAANITAGAGITVTNGANSITIAASTGAFTWSETSGAFTSTKQNGYFITTTASTTLPASPTEGDTIKFFVDTTNLLTITANTGQKIRIGTTLSAAAGTCINTQRGDSLELVYMSTGTTWQGFNSNGGWNIT